VKHVQKSLDEQQLRMLEPNVGVELFSFIDTEKEIDEIDLPIRHFYSFD